MPAKISYKVGEKIGPYNIELIEEVGGTPRKAQFKCPECSDPFTAAIKDVKSGNTRSHRECGNKRSGKVRSVDTKTRVMARLEENESGCMIFTGAKHRQGYGNTNKGLAHRLAYEYAFGEIPDGMHVLHKCDNPPCCDPDHLFLGTHTDNMADMKNKGRRKGITPNFDYSSLPKRDRDSRGQFA